MLGVSPFDCQFVLRLHISGRNHFLVVFDLYLILANCLVTSADVGWRFHRGDLRLGSQDNSFQSSQLTNNQFWLVAIFYLCPACFGCEVISASLFSVQKWVVTGTLACNRSNKSHKKRQINVRWNKHKNNNKNSGENHAYVQGVAWVTIEVDWRENSGISAILQNVTRI